MEKRNIIRNQKGFTLIEIIAVLVILGILAAVAVPKFFDMQESAEQKTCQIAVNDMNSRAVAAFSKSMLVNNGVAAVADHDTFGDLGFADKAGVIAVYKDFAAGDAGWTWSATVITYKLKNGKTTATFTLTPGTVTDPASIKLTFPSA